MKKNKNNIFLIFILTVICFCFLNTKESVGKDLKNNKTEKLTEKKYPVFKGENLAFPGAEGYGRHATGGREGEVYRVTNLNDDGEGSFRDAVSKPNRIIVFDVSGIIKMSPEPVKLQSNQTILGQTAPGGGIVLYGARISATGINNTIVRYLRVRMGSAYPGQADAGGMANGYDVIFDHCSFTWGKDENFSLSTDNKAPLKNITIQNSIIGQGLQNHSCGGLMQTSIEEGITIYRNLYIDNHTRNPKVKGLNQFVNNVVYNWGGGTAYDMGGNSKGPSETTIENNYFILGPAETYRDFRDDNGTLVTRNYFLTPAKPFAGGNALFRTYWAGNYYDDNKDGIFNGRPINWEKDCSGNPLFLDAPSELHPRITGQTSAEKAYEWIVKNVGANLPERDQVDSYLIYELLSLGTKGVIIKDEINPAQFSLGGPGVIRSGKKPLDTDIDGIPDEFEERWGLNKNDPSDAMKLGSNGYTNIENYSFSLEFPEKYR
jgi:hypothetical protein